MDTGGDTVPGGKITTPRFSDRSHVACAKNTSKFDAAGLAEAKYHIGEFGVEVLTPPIISNCGYQSFHRDHPEDILLCYSEISNIHRVVLQGWVNSWTHFCGPVVKYILEKAIPVFPRLSSLKVADVVKFYDSVQKISMQYLLPLMLFDSICLTFGFEGLCSPGLGTIQYDAIAFEWMVVLPRILPQEDSEIELIKFTVGYEPNNGFDLMWRVLELAVLGFKSTNPVQVPMWTADSDILSFCQENLLYFRLQSKHNMFFSSRTQSNIFLRNILQSEYADVVTTLQSHVNAYSCDYDEGYLPTNLCINGIATSIHQNATAWVRDVAHGIPCVRRMLGDAGYGSWHSSDWPDNDGLLMSSVQGLVPQVYRMEQARDCDHVPQFGHPYDRAGPAGHGGRGYGRPPPCDWTGSRDGGRDDGRPSPQDRSIHPGHRCRGFLPGVQCEACKRLGHVAANCDMLAMAIFLKKYVKQSISDEDERKIESNWVRRWKDELGKSQHLPRQVMKAYCADLDISPYHLDPVMDWACWPADEHGDFVSTQGLDGALPE